MFKHFDKRLERDVNRLVKARADLAEKTGKPTEVNVVTSNVQRYAVWFGGSLLSSDVRQFTELIFDTPSLFVFLIAGPKQNAGSLLTHVSDTVFYAL